MHGLLKMLRYIAHDITFQLKLVSEGLSLYKSDWLLDCQLRILLLVCANLIDREGCGINDSFNFVLSV